MLNMTRQQVQCGITTFVLSCVLVGCIIINTDLYSHGNYAVGVCEHMCAKHEYIKHASRQCMEPETTPSDVLLSITIFSLLKQTTAHGHEYFA